MFLGMLGYYRRFVPKFATLAEPLTNLLQGKVPFVWGEEQETGFNVLRKALSSEPILVYPNFDKKFTIQMDASLTALGGSSHKLGTTAMNTPLHIVQGYSIILRGTIQLRNVNA